MAIAFVQSDIVVTSGTSAALAYPVNVTAANWLWSSLAAWSSSPDPSPLATPTDTLTHTWTAAVAEQTPDGNTALRSWYVEDCSGGANTVTFAPAATGDVTGVVAEFSGVALTGSVEHTASAGPTASTAPATGNITDRDTDSMLIGAVTYAGADTTIAEEHTLIEENQGGSTNMPIAVQDIIGGTDQSLSWTLGASRTWVCHAVEVLVAAGGAAANPKGPLGNPLYGPLGGPV